MILYSENNVANCEVFRWVISTSINLLFLKSDIIVSKQSSMILHQPATENKNDINVSNGGVIVQHRNPANAIFSRFAEYNLWRRAKRWGWRLDDAIWRNDDVLRYNFFYRLDYNCYLLHKKRFMKKHNKCFFKKRIWSSTIICDTS